MTETITAWLVRNCPDFYFMPSLHYDRIFTAWGQIDDKMSPAYWQTRGFKVESLVECDEQEATHWLVDGKMVNSKFVDGRLAEWTIEKGVIYGVFDKESADAARQIGKSATPLKLHSAIVQLPHH